VLIIVLPVLLIAILRVGILKGVLFAAGMAGLIVAFPFLMLIAMLPLAPLTWMTDKLIHDETAAERTRSMLIQAGTWAIVVWSGLWVLHGLRADALRPVYFWSMSILAMSAVWELRTNSEAAWSPWHFAAMGAGLALAYWLGP
jgi:hypothetical protein